MKITAIAIVALAVMPLAGQGLPVTYERLLKADQEPGNWLTVFQHIQQLALQPPGSDQHANREEPPRQVAVSGTPPREV